MNKRFINICKDVNLIIAPCKYRNFNLKPGMMLFTGNRGFSRIDGEHTPFVADFEDKSGTYAGNDMGRPESIIGLHGYMLGNTGRTGIGYIYPSANGYSDEELGRLRNSVDLALGENKLKRLLLESLDKRYVNNLAFSVYDPKTDFASMFSHVIGDVYLQKFVSGGIDRLTTLSKEQVEAFNDMSPYGLVRYGTSPLKISDTKGLHGLLRAYFDGYGEDEEYTKEDVVDILRNLKEYYNKYSSDLKIVNVDDVVSFACRDATMPDGFNVKPFNVILEPEDANDYLYLERGSESLHLDSVMVDDNLHNVYLTSLHSGDPTGVYDEPMTFNGYYFDGEKFNHGYFSVKNSVASGIKDAICNSLVESSFFKSHVDTEEDFDAVRDIVDERITELEDADYIDENLIEDIYKEYLTHKKHMLESPIEYEELTDAELHAVTDAGVEPVDYKNDYEKDSDGLEDREF